MTDSSNVVPLDAVAEIANAYRRGMEAGKEHHLVAGRLLNAEKNKLAHGEWMPWFKANKERLGFGLSTANRLMSWAKNPDADASEAWGHKPKSAPARNLAGDDKKAPQRREPLAAVGDDGEWKWTGRKGDEEGLLEIDHEYVAEAVGELLSSAIESGFRMSKDDIRKVCEIVAELWEDEEIEAA